MTAAKLEMHDLLARTPSGKVESLRLLCKWLLFNVVSLRNRRLYLKIRALAAEVLGRLGVYERANVLFLPQLVKPGDTVLDIGASFGIYTVHLARLVGEAGRVYAFEPLSEVRSFLEQKVQRLRNVEVLPFALSDSGPACAAVHVPLLFGCIPEPALATLGKPDSAHYRINVQVRRLDQFITALPRVSFIKADIEGYELPFLEGASALIGRDRPIIQFEASEPLKTFAALGPFLAAHSYRVAFIDCGPRLAFFEGGAAPPGYNFYLLPGVIPA